MTPSVPSAVTPPHQPDHCRDASQHSLPTWQTWPYVHAIFAAVVLLPQISLLCPEALFVFYSNVPAASYNVGRKKKRKKVGIEKKTGVLICFSVEVHDLGGTEITV